jgi:glycosyltransferase involved in cell wall biosynthesis/predicted O-methyltransferase YrrM
VTSDRHAPELSIVIGFRDWGLDTLRLAVRAHRRSSMAARTEIIVVDYGSRDATGVRRAVESEGGRVLRVEAEGRWSRGRALNHGIRQAARAERLLTTDSDILFGPRTVEAILDAIRCDRAPDRVYALVQCRDLPEEVPLRDLEFPEWDRLEQLCSLRPRHGMGGCACFTRAFIEDVRGYDERMEWWGAEDHDLAARAEAWGMELKWVDDPRARIYHAWHEKLRTMLAEDHEFREAVDRNRAILHESRTIYRNLDRWGGLPSPPAPASVVIITRNRAALLEQAVDSVLGQSYQNFELLIVDDGSTDDTWARVQRSSDPRVRYVFQPPSGIPAARNAGVQRAIGEYICIHDDDDLMLPDRLRDHFNALTPGAVGSYGGWIDFEPGTGRLDYHPGKPYSLATILLGGKMMVHAGSMIRRDVLLRLPYNEDYAYGSDYDLNLRLVEAGYRLNHTGTYVILRRIHGANVTTTDRELQRHASRVSSGARVAALAEADRRRMQEEARQAREVEIRHPPVAELRRLFPGALGGAMHMKGTESPKRGSGRRGRPARLRLAGYALGTLLLGLLGWGAAVGVAVLDAADWMPIAAITLAAALGLSYLAYLDRRLRRLRRDMRHGFKESELGRRRLQQVIDDARRELGRELGLLHSQWVIASLRLDSLLVGGTWAAAEDFLHLLLKTIADRKPRVIVELGSGVSTAVIAKGIEAMGIEARFWAVEHDPDYVRQTRRLLEDNRLAARVELVHAPLVETGFGAFYDLGSLSPGLPPVDLLIVDGPPSLAGPQARYPALRVFHPLLSEEAVVILDDGRREDERQVAQRWKLEYADMDVAFVDNTRGCFVFRRRAGRVPRVDPVADRAVSAP